MIGVRVEADSISPYTGKRLTTFVLTYPRYVHSELLTHRVFSRNSASSRAIPTEKLLEMIRLNPVVPSTWGVNRRGMQAGEPIDPEKARLAEKVWLNAMHSAVNAASLLGPAGLDIHKQWVNRIVEPWMHITTVLSGTEWDNFYKLRCDQAALPEFQELAVAMRYAMEESQPKENWVHLPFISDDEYQDGFHQSDMSHPRYVMTVLIKVATGRIARVSYLTHDGRRDMDADIILHDRLQADGHMSPFEHCAFATPKESSHDVYACRNFVGWRQYRSVVEEASAISG